MEERLPLESKERLATFDRCIKDLEITLNDFLNTPQADIYGELSPLDAAKVDLTAAYTLNSLFWMYLNVCGANPKEHGIKQELERVRSYMNRIKEVEDKVNAPKVDASAAKRFVKSALWEAARKKGQEQSMLTPPAPASNTLKRTSNSSPVSHHKDKKRKG